MNRTKRPKCLTDKAKKKKAGETNFRVNNQARVDSLARHKAKQRVKGLHKILDPPMLVNFEKLKVPKLRAFLKKKGIKISARSKKADLVILAKGAK